MGTDAITAVTGRAVVQRRLVISWICCNCFDNIRFQRLILNSTQVLLTLTWWFLTLTRFHLNQEKSFDLGTNIIMTAPESFKKFAVFFVSVNDRRHTCSTSFDHPNKACSVYCPLLPLARFSVTFVFDKFLSKLWYLLRQGDAYILLKIIIFVLVG